MQCVKTAPCYANTMLTNMLAIPQNDNNDKQFFPDNIFALTVPRQLSNSLTFPEKWPPRIAPKHRQARHLVNH